MTPLRVFRTAAVAEAVTWGLLLLGMSVKYGTDARHLGESLVGVFGMLHGVVFLGYCLVTLLVSVDQRWPRGTTLLGLAAAVPPFATVWFDVYAERRGRLDVFWHTSPETNETTAERVVCWLLRHHRVALVAGAAAVGGLTLAALAVGPPA